jgi:hypothetical protein
MTLLVGLAETQAAAQAIGFTEMIVVPDGAVINLSRYFTPEQTNYLSVRLLLKGSDITSLSFSVQDETGTALTEVVTGSVEDQGEWIFAVPDEPNGAYREIAVTGTDNQSETYTFTADIQMPRTVNPPTEATRYNALDFGRHYVCSVCGHQFHESEGGLIGGVPFCYTYGDYEEELRARARNRRAR